MSKLKNTLRKFHSFVVRNVMALRWKMLALLALVRIGLGFQFQTLGSVSDQLVDRFNIDYTIIGTLIGLFMLAGLFLALPVGLIGRYLSDRSLASLGMALLAAGGFIAAFADSTTQIGAGRIVCGAGFVISTIYFAKMTTDWFAEYEIATAMGLLVMTWPLGIAAGQIIHTWLAQNSHWSTAFNVASLYCALGSVAVLLTYRAPAHPSAAANAEQTATNTPVTDTTSTHTPTAAQRSKAGLSRTELLLIVVASLSWALFNAGYVVFLSFAPAWLIESGYTSLQAASTTSSASWAMMISIVVGGVVADRTGRPEVVLYLCVVVAVVSLLSLYWTDFALPASVLFGLIGAAPAGIIMALASEAIEPQNRALGMGIFFSFYFLLMAPAPVLAGWLVDYSDSAWLAMVFAATLFVATAACYAAFRITQRAVTTSSV